jgi:hypothetical protein
MGEIVAFARPAPDATTPPKRKRERGFLLVPLRALDAARRLQDSLDLCVYSEGKRSLGETISWRSIYELLAIIDTATRVPGGEHE